MVAGAITACRNRHLRQPTRTVAQLADRNVNTEVSIRFFRVCFVDSLISGALRVVEVELRLKDRRGVDNAELRYRVGETGHGLLQR